MGAYQMYFGSLTKKLVRYAVHISLLLLLSLPIQINNIGHAFASGVPGSGWSVANRPPNQLFGTATEACYAFWSYTKNVIGGAEIGPDSEFRGSYPARSFSPVNCDWTSFLIDCRKQPLGAPGAPICGTGSVGQAFFHCPLGFNYKAENGGVCQKDDIQEDDPTCKKSAGNPIILTTGAKFEQKTDFSTSDGKLLVERFYRSTPQRRGYDTQDFTINAAPMGQNNGWGFWFAMEWHLHEFINSPPRAGTLFLPDGTAFPYNRTASIFSAAVNAPNEDHKIEFVGTPPTDWSTLFAAPSQWRVTEISTGRVWLLQTFAENYNSSTALKYSVARPTKITDVDGYVQNLTYGPMGELTSIGDSYGRTISISWNYRQLVSTPNVPFKTPIPAVVQQIILPDGNKLVYTYDPPGLPLADSPQRLVSVARKNAANNVVEIITYHYEDVDHPYFLTGITDNRGIRFATFAYDTEGRAILSEHAGSAGKITVSYSIVGSDFVRTVTNSLGKSAVYTFGYVSGGVKRIELKSLVGQASANCPLSNSTFANDSNGFVTSRTDQEGRVTTYTRDTLGRPLTMTRGFGTPSAVTTSYTWNPTWSTPSQVVDPGLTIDYTRNAAGQLTLVKATDTTTHTVPYSTAAQIRQTAYTYSTTGQLLTVDGPLAGVGDKVTYTYDVNGYLKTITNEVTHLTTVNTVNGRGQPTRVTDPNGVITDLVWDDLGRLTSMNVAPGATQALTSFTYNGTGDVLTVTRPGGVVLTMAYDNARRLTSVTNSAGESITYTRDLMDNITKTEVKAGTTIKAQRNQVFDELGRLIRTIGAGSTQTWAFGYDKTSNNTSVTDPRSKVWLYGFDSLNRLVTETEPGTGAVTLARNGIDEVTSYTDRRALVTSYVRNGFGDVIRQTSPDTGITDYTYDARGLVTQIKDARLVIANMTYDNAGRILTRVFPAATTENVTFAYDNVTAPNKGRGRLTQLTDQAGNSKFVYDVRGNLLSETRTIGTVAYVVSYTYDTADRLLTMTYPSGRIITYVRNLQGKITGVTSKANATATPLTLASNVAWQPMGGETVFGQGNLGTATQTQALPGTGGLGEVDLLQSLTYGNGLILWKNFSLDNELYQIVVEQGANTRINRFYNRADNTNTTGIVDGLAAGNNEALTYNDAARLSGATTGAGSYGTRLWTYDNNGNRLSETANGVANSYTYPANSNKLTNVKQGTVTTRAFVYDAAGNMTKDTRGATAYNYAVNNAGRIRTLTIGTTLRATWTYDGFQKLRIKAATSPVATTHYIWDSFGHIIAEHTSAGGVQKEYIWLGDTPLAVFEGANLFYVHPDHLDRPVMMTNATAQTIAWQAKYDPFGNPVTVTVSPVNNQRLPGQWFQIEDGLAYNWHRTYDPSLGRYSQADPLGFVDGPGIYNYAGGSPVMGVDPSGLETIIMVNDNVTDPYSIITGTHSGLYIDNGGEPILYDPNGSYVPPSNKEPRGGGDFFTGPDANFSPYFDYHRGDGPGTKMFRFPTTPDEEKRIADRITGGDNCGGFLPYCTQCVSQALTGIGPFRNLPIFTRPSGLRKWLENRPNNGRRSGI